MQVSGGAAPVSIGWQRHRHIVKYLGDSGVRAKRIKKLYH